MAKRLASEHGVKVGVHRVKAFPPTALVVTGLEAVPFNPFKVVTRSFPSLEKALEWARSHDADGQAV